MEASTTIAGQKNIHDLAQVPTTDSLQGLCSEELSTSSGSGSDSDSEPRSGLRSRKAQNTSPSEQTGAVVSQPTAPKTSGVKARCRSLLAIVCLWSSAPLLFLMTAIHGCVTCSSKLPLRKVTAPRRSA